MVAKDVMRYSSSRLAKALAMEAPELKSSPASPTSRATRSPQAGGDASAPERVGVGKRYGHKSEQPFAAVRPDGVGVGQYGSL